MCKMGRTESSDSYRRAVTESMERKGCCVRSVGAQASRPGRFGLGGGMSGATEDGEGKKRPKFRVLLSKKSCF